MSMRRAGIVSALTALIVACNSAPVTITPPRVAQGGRALSIAVSPTDIRNLVVATETGGLFRTFNGGESWQHLNLPNYQTVDVSFGLDPQTLIATTLARYRAISDGGIWRSTDGGGTWTQPSGWAPPPGLNCPSRPGAYAISRVGSSRTFYVGTDCGLAISNDDGATWSNIVIDAGGVAGDSAWGRMRAVLVLGPRSGLAAGDRGLWHLNAGGAWTKATTDPTSPNGVPGINSLADLPGSDSIPPILNPSPAIAPPVFTGPPVFMHASGAHELWFSTDGGANWIKAQAPGINNREALVRVSRSRLRRRDMFEVYYGDGMVLYRQAVHVSQPGGTGAWTALTTDHQDPSDVAFDHDRRSPILKASDGGVHRTSDAGDSWNLTGGGFGGFTALQINEITGQAVSGSAPHIDLYYSTQDNDIKASPDGGATWPGSVCCEGNSIRVAPASVNHEGSLVTGYGCGACFHFVAMPHFTSSVAWRNAPAGGPQPGTLPPFLIAGDAYIQGVANTATMPPMFDYYLSLSGGAAWSKSFTLPSTPKGPALFAGSLANPNVFQGIQRPGSLPDGGTRFGMMRITNLAVQPVVTRIDSAASGIAAFGSLRTPAGRYIVLGVDPRNPNHLIAPDVETKEMKFSADRGANWFSLPQLTSAVTGNGKYLFQRGELSHASVISWDPYDSCHILVGTIQNGIHRSINGGVNWAQIEGSTAITYVSSFHFPPSGNVWVSSNGRGLWNLKLDRKQGGSGRKCGFPGPRRTDPALDSIVAIDLLGAASVMSRGLADPAICATCTVVTVRNGWVTGLLLSGDSVGGIAISGGTISKIDRAGREIPLGIPNTYRAGEGRLEGRLKGRWLTGNRRVRALVLDGVRLKSALASRGELPFTPARQPTVVALNAGTSGTALSVSVGERIRVIGSGFLPTGGSAQPARILLDGFVVAERIQVNADGSFSVDVPASRPPGEIVITVEQRDGLRLTVEKTTFEIVTKDEDVRKTPVNPRAR
ncbi:MAG: glycoside hydrolase [Gemmatimonadota bacterium]|nr:glycoside hydrolase [Gemmatimonadota bacterium]